MNFDVCLIKLRHNCTLFTLEIASWWSWLKTRLSA